MSSNSQLPPNEPASGRAAQQKSSEEGENPPFDHSLQPHIQPSPEHKAKSNECRPDQTPIGKHVLEVVAAGILAAYTVAAFYQLFTMNGQLQQMIGSSDQTNRLLCLYRQQVDKLSEQVQKTNDLVSAANRQARSSEHLVAESKEANTQARKALTIQTRPWIQIDIKSLEVKMVKSPNFVTTLSFHPTYVLRNYGSSPAVRVVAILTTRAGGMAGDEPYEYDEPCGLADSATERREGRTESIFPGQVTHERTVEAATLGEPANPSGRPVRLFACIAYHDTEETPRIPYVRPLHHTKVTYRIPSQEMNEGSTSITPIEINVEAD